MKKVVSKFAFIIVIMAVTGWLVYNYSYAKTPKILYYPSGKSFNQDWKTVDSLESKGLTKSALEITTLIYEKAKKQNNHQQIVKALIYKAKFEQYVKEQAFINTLAGIEKEADISQYPLKPVLHSIVADMLWQYYQANRWKIYNRTQTQNFDYNDVETWDAKKLIQEINKHYLLSVKNIDSLSKTPVSTFKEIILQEEGSKTYRPFLFDFLSHRALKYFMNEEPSITKPTYSFTINDSNYFASAPIFSTIKIKTKDSLSLKYNAIKVLQKLTKIHLNDDTPEALIDIELIRLNFIKQNSSLLYNDTLHYSALKKLKDTYNSYAPVTEVMYELAQYHYQKGLSYNPEKNQQNKWQLKKAYQLCKKAIEKFPESYGAKKCKYLLSQIKTKTLNVVTEKVNTPNKPILAKVNYKNVDKVYVKLIKIEASKYEDWLKKNDQNDFFEKLNNQVAINTKELELPSDKDFQTHSSEFNINALSKGFYVLIVATNSKFSYKKEAVTYTPFWVSDMGYLSRNNNENTEFYVFDREKGNPLEGVTAQLYYEKYNYLTRRYETKKLATKTTNSDGSFTVNSSSEYRNFWIELHYKNEMLSTKDYFYQYGRYRDRKEQKNIKTILFTDRAIYRPGQTVFFKGIVIETSGDKNRVLENYSTKVELKDVNYQPISSLDLTTNEYGTFSGSFTLPTSSLNGQMSITNINGSKYFSVEEYKRPKFEVNFNPIEGVYKLNEKVSAKGLAKMYSGVPLDQAVVNYRVVRNASFPYWCLYRYGYWPQSSEMEIINGTTTTNDNGEFIIDFNAIPDQTFSNKFEPTYSYTVYADVTDLNGETHSSNTNVFVSNKALNLSVNIPNKLNKQHADSFSITTTNLNGAFQAANGIIKIFKVETPNQFYKTKLWSKPDKHILSQEEYNKKFPNYEFNQENNLYKWDKKEIVYKLDFNTAEQKKFLLNELKNWEQGNYYLEAITTDKFGEKVKEEKYFTIYDKSSQNIATNDLAWYTPIKTTVEPGDEAELLIGSKASNVKVLYEIEHKGVVVEKNWLKLNNNQQLIKIPIKEEHRGNFTVFLTFVKHGRSFTYNEIIGVPYTNKQLDITFGTFRNKLLPGQQEEWNITIKNKKGDKVAAEMIATMYDASLDAFRANNFYLNLFKYHYSSRYWRGNSSFSSSTSNIINHQWNEYFSYKNREYDQLNWFGYYYYDNNYYQGLFSSTRGAALSDYDGVPMTEAIEEVEYEASGGKNKLGEAKKEISVNDVELDNLNQQQAKDKTVTTKNKPLKDVKARKNFNETAFFYPQLTTNEKGEINIKFTVPESLTKWKFLGLAHTKDLSVGTITKELVTQKKLMIYPNMPRYFREGDKMQLLTKVVNMSEKDLIGEIQLNFYDAITMQDVTNQLIVDKQVKQFDVLKDKSALIEWNVVVPENLQAITYKIVAVTDDFSDGEEMSLPVLTNRMLVTESLPLPIRGNQTKTYTFEKLANNKSTTLKHHKLTLEYTSNPAWYAIQALPYLMEYPYECAEQTFSRYYANTLAASIANSTPKIKAVFDSWKKSSPKAFLSNLEKNQELKELLLQETPWVMQAKNESERKKRVALLFDLNRMANEQNKALRRLKQLQVANGGWTWFKGMPESRYITQHIVTGMGHLKHLEVININTDYEVKSMIHKAVYYLDDRINEDYEWIMKHSTNPDDDHIGYNHIQYLYARSYFLPEQKIQAKNQKAYYYFINQAEKYWLNKTLYMKGMIALALNRNNPSKTGIHIEDEIMASIKENSINHEELGMYWKSNAGGYYWYQAPIETQALLIEAFDEVANDKESVDDMKVWLIKQKQTQNWTSTKATTEACYALLLRGEDLLFTESAVDIYVNNKKINPKKATEDLPEAGTGYFKTSWQSNDISSEMANIKVVKKNDGPAWGAIYWQYFEQLDKITPHKTPLQLIKKVFKQTNTKEGVTISPVTPKTKLKPGDKLKIRIELRVDRNMEYVHMKDMRAAGLEPTQVFSGYRYQDGLGYYQSTKDASTNFFFDYLPKGTYVFEYPLVVNVKGNFSNGITTIQCMYAPEFTSHSEGIRLNVQQ